MSEKSQTLKKVCIICSKEKFDDVYAAMVLANGAVMEGIEVKLFFTFSGLNIIKKQQRSSEESLPNGAVSAPNDSLDQMKLRMEEMGVPSVSEFIDFIDAGGGDIFACKMASDMFGLRKDDFVDQVKAIISVGQFYEMCGGENTQIIYI